MLQKIVDNLLGDFVHIGLTSHRTANDHVTFYQFFSRSHIPSGSHRGSLESPQVITQWFNNDLLLVKYSHISVEIGGRVSADSLETIATSALFVVIAVLLRNVFDFRNSSGSLCSPSLRPV